MKKALVLLLGVCFVALLIGSVAARDVKSPGRHVRAPYTPDRSSEIVDPGLRGVLESAAVDTFCMAKFNFETMNWQGWTRADMSTQIDTFWHVDDFSMMGTAWYPIQGLKSMWCGARADSDDPYLCGWALAPGYGNDWNQYLVCDPFQFTGQISLKYSIRWDSETAYDYTYVEYDAGDGNWEEVIKYDDIGTDTATVYVNTAQIRTKLRFRFESDGGWSDMDGDWDSQTGPVVLDEITISDAFGLTMYENFEAYPVNAKECGIWHARIAPPFGQFSGLMMNLQDKDPCGDNFTTQVVYFVGSPWPSSSYPGLYDTPYCTGPGGIESPCQFDCIVSPEINMTMYSSLCNTVQDVAIPTTVLSTLGGVALEMTVYGDCPLESNVFISQSCRKIESGCPTVWEDENTVWYTPGLGSYRTGWWWDIGTYVAGNDPVQLMIGCIDMCNVWYLVYGNCQGHTPAPWVDNVSLKRWVNVGPQFVWDEWDQFQDNFPSGSDVYGYVRADAAQDILANDNPNILPGDSMIVACTSLLGGGLAADPKGGPAIYIHVKATGIGPDAKPKLYGASLAGSVTVNDDPYEVVNFRYVRDDRTWTQIQMDTLRFGGTVKPDEYMIDLNDELFTRGYRIEYYFSAKDADNVTTYLPSWAPAEGPYLSFDCLPTWNNRVLYVDDCGMRGITSPFENVWQDVFNAVLSSPKVDVYSVGAPSSGVASGPSSRASGTITRAYYDQIVWDSGNYEQLTITDASSNSDKSNDAQWLNDWMALSPHPCGLWICGDGVARDLTQMGSAPALTLLSYWCGVDLVAESYFAETGGLTGGGIVAPLMTGHTDAGIFVHSTVPDKFYAFGGCPGINEFNCLEKTDQGKYALSYPAYGGTNYYSAIASERLNNSSFPVRTMFFGFSFVYVRDDKVDGNLPMDKYEIANDVFSWMQNETNINITDVKTPPAAYSLAQNYPNPFNPSTTIRYDMREKGFVTLKIYNVAGQLVRTLVDGVKDATSHSVTWDGLNNHGSAVASGIYFYKMETKDFSQTKKMVMLR